MSNCQFSIFIDTTSHSMIVEASNVFIENCTFCLSALVSSCLSNSATVRIKYFKWLFGCLFVVIVDSIFSFERKGVRGLFCFLLCCFL